MTDTATSDLYRINAAILPMRAAASSAAECTNECLYGEVVYRAPAFDRQADTTGQSEWVLVKTQRDGYTGYVQTTHLQRKDTSLADATHRVCATSTLVFDAPCIKSRVLHRLPLLSHISGSSCTDSPFYQLDSGGFVWRQHALEINQPLSGSPLALAQAHFLGAPYLWGGCTPQGVDCSGLVQALASAKGLQIPRDSGDQERALTQSIDPVKRQAEDLVYWPGHTGILLDKDTLLHATAHTLSSVIEPLDDVVARAGNISSIKRLF